MTFEDIVKSFEEVCPPKSFMTESGFLDKIAQAEAFNAYTDMLCKDGQISLEEYHEMPNPY